MLIQILAISVGAALGALSRWQISAYLNAPHALLPWGTLTANLIGGYLIGVAIAVFQAQPEIDPVWRLAIITGFLGALTTFSSFSAEVVTMLMEQRLGSALLTAGLHLGLSLLLTYLGLRSAHWVLAH